MSISKISEVHPHINETGEGAYIKALELEGGKLKVVRTANKTDAYKNSLVTIKKIKTLVQEGPHPIIGSYLADQARAISENRNKKFIARIETYPKIFQCVIKFFYSPLQINKILVEHDPVLKEIKELLRAYPNESEETRNKRIVQFQENLKEDPAELILFLKEHENSDLKETKAFIYTFIQTPEFKHASSSFDAKVANAKKIKAEHEDKFKDCDGDVLLRKETELKELEANKFRPNENGHNFARNEIKKKMDEITNLEKRFALKKRAEETRELKDASAVCEREGRYHDNLKALFNRALEDENLPAIQAFLDVPNNRFDEKMPEVKNGKEYLTAKTLSYEKSANKYRDEGRLDIAQEDQDKANNCKNILYLLQSKLKV